MLFLPCVEALPLAEHVSTVEVYGNKTETTKVTFTLAFSLLSTFYSKSVSN